MKLNTKPLKDIEYGFPVIAAGTYLVGFLPQPESMIKSNKAGTGNNLQVRIVVLDENLIKADGSKFENHGQVKLTKYISLVPTEDYNPDSMLKELAVACQVPADKEDFEISDIKGIGRAKISYRPAEKQYSEGNSVDRFYALKEGEETVNPPAWFTMPY